MDEPESCSEEGPVRVSQTEANALDTEANAPPAIETMVLDLNVTETKVELIRKAISRPQALAPALALALAPSIRSTPIDEIGKSERLFAMAFPTLFPIGVADWHQGRIRSLDLQDWGQHMLKFHDGRFATHPRFRFLLFNLLIRQRARSSARYFVKSSEAVG